MGEQEMGTVFVFQFRFPHFLPLHCHFHCHLSSSKRRLFSESSLPLSFECEEDKACKVDEWEVCDVNSKNCVLRSKSFSVDMDITQILLRQLQFVQLVVIVIAHTYISILLEPMELLLGDKVFPCLCKLCQLRVGTLATLQEPFSTQEIFVHWCLLSWRIQFPYFIFNPKFFGLFKLYLSLCCRNLRLES